MSIATLVGHDATASAHASLHPSALRELADLLAPIAPDVFTTGYWCQRPLFIKGSADKLQRLFPGGFERPDFYRAARASAAARSEGFQLLARGRQELFGGTGPRPSLAIQPEQMEWLFAAGANLRADNLLDPRLLGFATAIKAQLQHVGEVYVAATLSPRGNGWPPHIDRTSVVFIQSEGAKRFTISPAPVVPWPDTGTLLARDGTAMARDKEVAAWEEFAPVDMDDVCDVVLEPGDVLFLPPGTIHATEALTEASLTVDLLLSHASALDVVMSALVGILKGRPEWRHTAPVDVTRAEPGRLPAETAAFLGERLAELRRVLDGLTPSSPELVRAWQRAVADPGEVLQSALVSEATLRADAKNPTRRPLVPDQRLRLTCAPTLALGQTADGAPTADLFVAGQEVSVVGEWVPFVRALASTREFVAGWAIGWSGSGHAYSWEAVRATLEMLLDRGLIEAA